VLDDPDATHWSYAGLNLPGAWQLTTGSHRIRFGVSMDGTTTT
jgi:hypothetical protein